jgi:hypothetical protein
MPEMLQMQRFAEPEPVRRYAPETPEQLDRLITQLLSKEPEDRFPNVLVLGRHMEAMEKALSRPAAPHDDEELELEWPTNPTPGVTAPMLRDATNAGAPILLPTEPPTGQSVDLYGAPTIAQPDEPVISAVAPPAPPTPRPTATRFTTVDEEARRKQREEEEEGQLALIARWVALVVLVGGLLWGGWWLLRPATADELYHEIMTTVENEGDDDLRLVENDLGEFMERFPNDERAAELAEYVQQLEFQKLQRRARLRTNIAGEAELGPIVQLYLAALEIAESDPARSKQMLSDLVDLYDPLGVTATGEVTTGRDRSALSAEDRQWLVLARKELEKLNREAQADAAKQLPAVKERLAATGVVARNRPEQAKRMYEAIIRLYGDQPWAAAQVAEARKILDEMETTETE